MVPARGGEKRGITLLAKSVFAPGQLWELSVIIMVRGFWFQFSSSGF